MAKKYISFLGTNRYVPANYYYPTEKHQVDYVCYVQEAIIPLLCADWTSEDEALIFLTEKAEQENWSKGGDPKNKKDKKRYPEYGLEKRLEFLKKEGNYSLGIRPIRNIPKGIEEDEIWELFDRILAELAPKDQIILDITYSFRSIPMLGMVLMNYAKLLKGVEVIGVYYGAFETLGQAFEVWDKDTKDRNAPIVNLMGISELQDWTIAAESFLNGGNAQAISKKIGLTQSILAENLEQFTNSLLMCRGKDLKLDLPINNLKTIVSVSQQTNIQAQLQPILEKVEEKIAPFESRSVRNGLAAVQWCIDHKMIQQGYTFLQETIVSLTLEESGFSEFLLDSTWRLRVSPLMGRRKPTDLIRPPKPDDPDEEPVYTQKQEEELKKLNKIYAWIKTHKKIRTPYRKLTGKKGLRNDVNHLGMKPDPAKVPDLIKHLDDILKELITILQSYNLL